MPLRRVAVQGCISREMGSEASASGGWDGDTKCSLGAHSCPPAGTSTTCTMGLSRKEQVFLALLGASGVSGLTALILLLVEATSVLLPTDIKFGIVFDAGSSHTSLFLYQWPANKENGTGVVSQALACQVEGPGISSYTSNPAQAGESLQGCLEEALVLIPEAQHRKTPTFLGATAGMRLLSQKNSSQARDIFAAITQVLGRSPVDFWGAELLAGQDEGAFGWITVNYGLGTLVKYSFTGEWIQPPEETLVGALDMGGASTQITFVPGGPILDKSTQADFRLYGSDYSVYTHSYLCFGRDQMLSRLLVGLVQSRPAALLRHPCYLSGYQTTLALAPLYESPCVHTTPPLSLPQNLTVEGTGNPGACVSAIRELFNFSSCQGQEDCAFNGVYQPPLQGQFYAFSNFYYTFHFLNLTSGQPLSTVNATIWEFCQRPWKLVEASYPGQDRWLRDYCASGLYILTLLHEGYGFSEETWPSLEFRKQAGGVDIGWTLGYMLNLTGMIPADAPAQRWAASDGIWVAKVVFMVLALVVVVGAASVQLFWLQD
ncbi:ectonucleoside triphosphate diphosphohydrolase 8 isoform X2 [Pongo pygmaeus]|uniref:ectonucleoside triphosphate diphosphohydrolase 8 isoform X2 n=2 Tax=Pongo pygmaeus TaxID=9600 RepID=UPI0023E2C4D8|nr:ectonucleoside triphosphate diphosphohydrolase 8 isoform X2 [Pongo pygmaeus]